MRQYVVYRQCTPLRVVDESGEECWQANLVRVGAVQASSPEEAMEAARRLTPAPVIEPWAPSR